MALLALTGFCLSPAIGTGYWAEDIYYSAMVPSSPILNQTSWFTETWLGVKNSFEVGRFYPITPVITAVAFILFQNVAVYKAYIVAVTLLDVALYYGLIWQLTGRRGFAAFATGCTVGLFQFRLTVDPMLGYYAQIQWVIAAFFASLICLRHFFASRRWEWLGLSVLAYLICTLTYELTYPLVLIPLYLIARTRPGWRRGLLLAGPFVGSAGFAAGMTVLARCLHPSNNYVHTTDFGWGGMLQSLGCQLSAGLPLSYYCADPLRLFSKGRDLAGWFAWILQPRVVLVAITALIWYARVLRGLRRHSVEPGRLSDVLTLAGLGVLLAVAPTLLIAISPFHRHYLSFGVGWIGVMVQYYGVGLLLALVFWRILAGRVGGGPFGRTKSLVVSTVLAGVLATTYRANIEVATALNASVGSDRYREFAAAHGAAWHWQRLNLIAALDAGVMSVVPDGSRVELANLYPYWHDSLYGQFFYTKQTGKRIETLPTRLPTRLAADAPLFRVRDVSRDRNVGLVIVTPSIQSPTEIPRFQGRVFVKHPALRESRTNSRLLFLVGHSGTKPDGPARILQLGTDLPLLRAGSGWGLFALDTSESPPGETFRLVDNPIQVAAWLRMRPPTQAAVDQANKPVRR